MCVMEKGSGICAMVKGNSYLCHGKRGSSVCVMEKGTGICAMVKGDQVYVSWKRELVSVPW